MRKSKNQPTTKMSNPHFSFIFFSQHLTHDDDDDQCCFVLLVIPNCFYTFYISLDLWLMFLPVVKNEKGIFLRHSFLCSISFYFTSYKIL